MRTTNMKSMIVDDDSMSRKSLERFCSKTKLVQLEAICQNAGEALKIVGEKQIDLIFLDIEMPEISGIDFLNELTSMPQIIFTTSKTEYAFEAFEYQVTDYLKKPITQPRFMKAVEKAFEIFQQNQDYKTKADEVYIKESGKFIRVPYDNILFFENVGDYVRIKTIDSSHIIHSTLKNIDAKLDKVRFLRVHRSFIVNLKKIVDIEENSLVIDQNVIPISRANRPVLMSRLNFL